DRVGPKRVDPHGRKVVGGGVASDEGLIPEGEAGKLESRDLDQVAGPRSARGAFERNLSHGRIGLGKAVIFDEGSASARINLAIIRVTVKRARKEDLARPRVAGPDLERHGREGGRREESHPKYFRKPVHLNSPLKSGRLLQAGFSHIPGEHCQNLKEPGA